jgi:hypothetical protein
VYDIKAKEEQETLSHLISEGDNKGFMSEVNLPQKLRPS